MTTFHQYLAKYPIDPSSETLIVGTIHPNDHGKFIIPFFYGSECSLWTILHEAFPTELPNPFSLEDIKRFLHRRKISMSDMIWACNRTHPSALDEDLEPLRLNYELPDQIRRSSIQEIFFTSGFGKNAAFHLFYSKVLGRPITKAIKESREVSTESTLFGRPVRLRILFSPSDRACTGISRNREYLACRGNYGNSPTPVKAFRVDHYRQMFGN